MRQTPSEPRSEPPPTLAGRYRVVSTLTADASGRSYLAFDQRLRRWRVIRVADGEAARRRLARDAELLGRLEHPGVERIVDIGEDGPLSFAVRDRLSGRLSEHAPLSPALAAQVVLRVAEGLAHAHARSVFHGHVRPSVVRFAEDGGAVLTGFGEVPEIDRSTSGRAAEPWVHLAPELRQRWAPDAQSEVYALGATLYTVIAARNEADLFYAESYEGLLAPIPGPLRSVVIAACAYEPRSRPDGVEAFRGLLLGRAAALGPVPAPPWRRTDLPDDPPDAIVPDAGVAELIAVLGRRREGSNAVVVKSDSSTIEKTPLPYVMPAAPAHKDAGFRDPFERVGVEDLPDYVDKRFAAVKRPPPSRTATAPASSIRTQAPPAPRGRPIWPIGVGVLVVGTLVLGGVGWVATAPARADAAFVSAVAAETTAASLLAQVSPDRAAVEEAWFRFTDAPTPEHAAAFVRLAEQAAQAATATPEAKLAVERMSEAMRRWER